ncbi:cationic peroxidase 1-like [Chenopodium quinoa]|uniref:Peroxidase n=1 Tax=Chenopodium quinoa TaxID=63459 RepID=A0A803L3A2_CHEQI|nr:cationic peroxidase 1-like [Chenopodium quinoa]
MASSLSLQCCLISILFGSAFAQLSENFYVTSCPQANSIIQSQVKLAVAKEARMGAALLRLHFIDCLIGGCDGSILLDDTQSAIGERTALVNGNSTIGFEVIDAIKARLEKACPGVVSCADILAVAARDSVVMLGGPSWTTPLGRRDSTEAHKDLADTLVPVFLGDVNTQIGAFAMKGFSKNEFVALAGSHTVGLARCQFYRKRVYEAKNIDPTYAASLQANCPKEGGDNNTAPIDSTTPFVFDNAYFVNLMKQKGLLNSDQQLYTGKGGPTDAIVANYSSNQQAFFDDYAKAVVKIGKMEVLTGTHGEVRTNCRRANGATN